MQTTGRKAVAAINIWWLALGYFAFYIPYSALVKALSSGLMAFDNGIGAAARGPVSGLVLLPSVVIGTAVTMPLILFGLGWYRYFGRRRVAGFSLPLPSPWAAGSGIAFAVIIATTTLAYTFHGVSIIFALLLMRGGVLIMSPIIDKLFCRPVHWFSWAGFGLSLLAVSVALAQLPDYGLSGLVLLNLGAYLGGYLFRLRFITRCAKDVDETVNRRFFIEENTVAMAVLVLIPGLAAVFGPGAFGMALREGFTTFLSSGREWLGFIIGAFYGCLGIFGSLIYLNRRENTFSICINRCASLLSGLVASFILIVWFNAEPLNAHQLAGAVIILFALVLMSLFDTRHMAGKDNHNPMQRVFLFICDSNHTRSPMAAAICNEELRRRLGLDAGVNARVTAQSAIYAKSAGLTLREQRDLPARARDALVALAVPIPEHQASEVNVYGMHRAEKVLCMTGAQERELLRRFPWAAEKIVCLDRQRDIPEPSGAEMAHFLVLAHAIRGYVGHFLNSLGLKPELNAAEVVAENAQR
ncbi:MAG: hypothetical protein P8Y42_19825 [Exilibacterium sp.]